MIKSILLIICTSSLINLSVCQQKSHPKDTWISSKRNDLDNIMTYIMNSQASTRQQTLDQYSKGQKSDYMDLIEQLFYRFIQLLGLSVEDLTNIEKDLSYKMDAMSTHHSKTNEQEFNHRSNPTHGNLNITESDTPSMKDDKTKFVEVEELERDQASPHHQDQDEPEELSEGPEPLETVESLDEHAEVSKPDHNSNKKHCGQRVRKRDKREDKKPQFVIVGGLPSHIGQFPWQVTLQNKGKHFCGGTIIGACYVLTASHCIFDADKTVTDPKDIQVRHGTVDWRNGSSVKVKKVFKHPKFDHLENDIAMIITANKIKFDDHTNEICMPSEGNFRGKGIVTGWGMTEESIANGTKLSNELESTEVEIISKQECEQYLKKVFKMETMLCQSPGNKGACTGDSGGPVFTISSDDSATLRGVVSYVYGDCGNMEKPATIYTDVHSYLPFINGIIEKNPC